MKQKSKSIEALKGIYVDYKEHFDNDVPKTMYYLATCIGKINDRDLQTALALELDSYFVSLGYDRNTFITIMNQYTQDLKELYAKCVSLSA
jgi:hypothetical protein